MTGDARSLVLTGGIGHPFADSAPALAACLARAGSTADVTEDIEAGLATLASGGYRLVCVYALRWSMATGDKYASHRAAHGFTLSQAGRAALQAHVAGGGGLLALHTGIICFDGWPEWREMLGGVWDWGRSNHPPRGPVHVAPTASHHPVTAGVVPFDLEEDEVYARLDLRPGIVPLVDARARNGDDGAWPAVWSNDYGRGRIVCDTLGHDRRSIETPPHGRLIVNAARWLLEAQRQ
jgi:type 1 glutamine amidotransferase